jgi:serine/threonine protein kinase
VSEGVGRFVGDRYHIVREIGRGGMGVVYLGRDLRRDMDVAIKFRHIAQHEAQLWLKREFRAVASLRHANLVELYELAAHGRSCYFTMEYLEGVDPRQWVMRRRVRLPEIVDQSTVSVVPLQQAHTELSPSSPAPASVAEPPDADFSRVRAVLAQLAEGVAFLHARGVIHRDIKPSNVFIHHDGFEDAVKLIDFGVARLREITGDTGALTGTNHLIGSMGYMAPEQFRNAKAVGFTADLYAVGVVVFRALTGRLPFVSRSLENVIRMKAEQSAPPISTMPGMPKNPLLDRWATKAMARTPEARFSNAREMLEHWWNVMASLDEDAATDVMRGIGRVDESYAGPLHRSRAADATIVTPADTILDDERTIRRPPRPAASTAPAPEAPAPATIRSPVDFPVDEDPFELPTRSDPNLRKLVEQELELQRKRRGGPRR